MRKRLLVFILIVIIYLFFQVAFVFRGDDQSTITFTTALSASASQPFEYSQHTATKEFIKYFVSENLDIDAPQCVFPDPQFSPEEELLVFKYKNYPSCKTSTKAEIVVINNTVHAKCRNHQKPLFVYDDGSRQILGGNFQADLDWTFSPKLNPKSEFFIVQCGKNSIYSFSLLRFNARASEKANLKRKDLGWNSKNFNVFLLVLDQVSRYGAKRNLPRLMKFLEEFRDNEQFNSQVSYYNFEKTPTVAPFTINNMIPILYGKTHDSVKDMIGTKLPQKNEFSKRHAYYQQKYSLWKFYSSLGYTTMMLLDTVYDFFVTILGRDLLVDHAFVNFWRTAYAVYGWTDFSPKQRCLGDKDSHALSLEYLYQYAETYKANNKFSYVHLHAAHESSGNIRTVDKDILPFLERFLSLMIKRQENFVFILMSDHGTKYMTRHMWDIRSFYEANDPMFHLFMSKEVEQQWNLTGILSHNVKSVVDRFDINLSLKDLAYFPYQYQRHVYYENFKENYPKKGVSSIFYEKISSKRSCSDILVSEDYCLCKKLTDIDYYDENSNLILVYLKELIVKYFELQSQREPGCNPIGEFEVIYSKMFKMIENKLGGDSFYYLELSTDDLVEIEVIARFTSISKIEMSGEILPEEVYPFDFFDFNSKTIFLQIASVDVRSPLCSQNCLC